MSCNKDNFGDSSVVTISRISFPSPPIEICTSSELGVQFINYFNIVKVRDDMFYMYYQAFDGEVFHNDFDQNIYFAYSTDGFHWKHERPGHMNNIILRNVVEMSVFRVPDETYPFRLIGNVLRDQDQITSECNRTLCIWKSKDGLLFEQKSILLDDVVHDTQNVMLVYNNYMKLYTRDWIWGEINNKRQLLNRKVAVCNFDFNGKQLTSLEMLPMDHLYNSAASLYKGYELLFPTYFDEIEGGTDSCYVKNYIVNNGVVKELECEFNNCLQSDENWVIISPGIIEINNRTYISYVTNTASHDNQDTGKEESRFKLVEIKFD